MSTPAAVLRKAREHNISRAEAKRIIAATERVQAIKAERKAS
jgi:hypothetical protein